MEKLKMETPSGAQELFAKLAKLVPECVVEKQSAAGGVRDNNLTHAIDFDKLKQLLDDHVREGEEAYEFTWVGKKAALVEANTPIQKTLRPVKEESKDWDTTENLYIEGDNLDVLKLLQESYLGKVKMIYIDPPYNTGNDFIYNDDFKMNDKEYDVAVNAFDDNGNRMFRNTDANGKFHSDWCTMIYSRLLVSRNLLKRDGVIFISIDENEVSPLKMICDEIFGASNFIAELVWAAGRKNDSKYISTSHEYILCYFRDAEYVKQNKVIWRERKRGLDEIYTEYEQLKEKYGNDYHKMEVELKLWYKDLPDGHPAKEHQHYNHIDSRGVYFPDNISWPGGGGPKYDVLHPVTHKPVKVPSRGWITANRDTMQRWIDEDRVLFGKDENSVPTLKAYLKDRESAVPYSVFYQDGRAASKRLASLMGDKVFENPKDEEILKRLIEFIGIDDGEIVLDFFAGSASTAHAVLSANLADKKNIHFIMVQLAESIDEKKCKSERSKKVARNAIKLLDSLSRPHTIAEISKERIRRAGAKILAEHPEAKDLDTGFRVLRVDSSNMKDVYYRADEVTQASLIDAVDNVKEDRSALDLLFGCLVDWGLPLSLPYAEETIAGVPVLNYSDGDLIACFAAAVPEAAVRAIAERQPLRAVFRDSSFADSPARINVEEIFRLLSPDTDLRVL